VPRMGFYYLGKKADKLIEQYHNLIILELYKSK